jgi:4-hydroxy-tetrahydrodipicolinate reductase
MLEAELLSSLLMETNSERNRVRVALVGHGRMGREIERLAAGENIDIVSRFSSRSPLSLDGAPEADVAIEFTHPDAVVGNIRTLLEAGLPIVVGTTGWLADLETIRSEAAMYGGRLVYASNFSIGVNIFFRIIASAARLIDSQPMYDAAIHEIHHTGKADSPSGTALAAAKIVLDALGRKSTILSDPSHGKIDPAALHVSSQRLGSTVGTHALTFDSDADTIEIVHRAKNREGFALGALLAARWIVDQKPGVYRFEEIFGEERGT